VMAVNFELFTSLRYDARLRDANWNNVLGSSPSALFFLPYHLDRFILAAEYFQWPLAIQVLGKPERVHAMTLLQHLCQDCVNHNTNTEQPLRIRIKLSRDGLLKAEAFPTLPLTHDLLHASTFNPAFSASFRFPARQLRVYLDTESTPQSEYTAYKTTLRAHYDAARARVGIISPIAPEEVLLYNTSGCVMEGSVRNVAFWRGERWVTPGLESGCLAGTMRRWLLEQGRVVEGEVRRKDVRVGEWVLLCNGVEGCLLGVV
ncbi:D-aminoacid aminotransferase-like PLP-dependent enzyme, partial [Ramaria rubella]